jgi:hypothetical protein
MVPLEACGAERALEGVGLADIVGGSVDDHIAGDGAGSPELHRSSFLAGFAGLFEQLLQPGRFLANMAWRASIWQEFRLKSRRPDDRPTEMVWQVLNDIPLWLPHDLSRLGAPAPFVLVISASRTGLLIGKSASNFIGVQIVVPFPQRCMLKGDNEKHSNAGAIVHEQSYIRTLGIPMGLLGLVITASAILCP